MRPLGEGVTRLQVVDFQVDVPRSSRADAPQKKEIDCDTIQEKDLLVQTGIVHVQRLTGLELFDQVIHETSKDRETFLWRSFVVFLVKQVVQENVVLPQKSLEYMFSNQLR